MHENVCTYLFFSAWLLLSFLVLMASFVAKPLCFALAMVRSAFSMAFSELAIPFFKSETSRLRCASWSSVRCVYLRVQPMYSCVFSLCVYVRQHKCIVHLPNESSTCFGLITTTEYKSIVFEDAQVHTYAFTSRERHINTLLTQIFDPFLQMRVALILIFELRAISLDSSQRLELSVYSVVFLPCA